MIYQISHRKAAKGHIMPGLCQVNNTWLEPTYYIYTLGTYVGQNFVEQF